MHTVHVIAHTHWDREWYMSFQRFRIRLVRLIDELLDLLERDPSFTHFNLDAQTIVLRDYLEIRPERRATLARFIAAGRIGVGPWHVLPDEFLVSGEALVRNLQLGHRLSAEFGHTQRVGYVPDTFGHIAQLPQILRGFDLDTAMLFRGLNQGDFKAQLEWQSPDGSRVLLHHLPTDVGYADASALPFDVTAAANDLQVIARHAAQRATTSHILVMNGVDHLVARPDLPAILKAATDQSGGEWAFVQSSLEKYFASVTSELRSANLQIVHGEIRDTNRTPGHGMRVLPNILSARIDNKLQNERAQTLLERWAEPWSALLWTQGAPYPAAFLWRAWEWVLENHPHDSIGGCSVDEVHAQMATRFAWATDIADEITNERFHLIARELDLSDLADDEAALVVFNALPWAWHGPVTVDIDLWTFYLNRVAMQRVTPPVPESALSSIADFGELFRWRTHYEWADNPPIMPDATVRGLRVRPLGGAAMPVQIEAITRHTITRPLISGPATFRDVVHVRAAFEAAIPAYGYQVFAVRPQAVPNRPQIDLHPHNVLENKHLRVTIETNGTLTIVDKATGQIYRDLAFFEDGGDCGDGYNYSPPAQDRVANSIGLAPHISRLSAGPCVQRYRIDYDWPLSVGLNDTRSQRREDTVRCALSLTVSLAHDSRRVDLDVSFDNRARDHRLRLIFPSDVRAAVSHADAQFDVVAHPVEVEPVPAEVWVEDAPTTFPQQGWVDVSDETRGLGVINRGLPEYEVLNTERREIAITLLRAVGYLGASVELQTTVMGAGPNVATPGAQLQQRLNFALALVPHAGDWQQAQVWREAQAFHCEPRAITVAQMDRPHGPRPATDSLLHVDGANVIVSAVKKSEQDEALIVRLYNPSDVETHAVIAPPFRSSRVQPIGLNEQSIEAALVPIEADGRVRVAIAPHRIITLRFDRETEAA